MFGSLPPSYFCHLFHFPIRQQFSPPPPLLPSAYFVSQGRAGWASGGCCLEEILPHSPSFSTLHWPLAWLYPLPCPECLSAVAADPKGIPNSLSVAGPKRFGSWCYKNEWATASIKLIIAQLEKGQGKITTRNGLLDIKFTELSLCCKTSHRLNGKTRRRTLYTNWCIFCYLSGRSSSGVLHLLSVLGDREDPRVLASPVVMPLPGSISPRKSTIKIKARVGFF